MKLITLSLFNRYNYTASVLEHLAACHGIKDYVVLPVIDNDPKSDNQAAMLKLLSEFAQSGELKIDMPRFHDTLVGCNANIFTCLNVGFTITDFVIHIEDDILLAKDALQYFEWAKEKYRDDPTVFTVDAYNNESHASFPSAYSVKRAGSFKPWGWATWVDRWLDIKDRWQFGYASRPDLPSGGGWDVCMKQALRGDRHRAFPVLSRAKNIGAFGGCHTPSADWHWAKHNIKYWSNDLDQLEGKFEEISNGE